MAPRTLFDVGPSSCLLASWEGTPVDSLIRFSYRLLYQIIGKREENRTYGSILYKIFVRIANFLRPNTGLDLSGCVSLRRRNMAIPRLSDTSTNCQWERPLSKAFMPFQLKTIFVSCKSHLATKASPHLPESPLMKVQRHNQEILFKRISLFNPL